MDLDRVVVTATGFEQKLTEAPASISVITREELAARPYTTLVDALRDVEGIDVGMETTDKNGQGSISMRGLPSEYTLVLIAEPAITSGICHPTTRLRAVQLHPPLDASNARGVGGRCQRCTVPAPRVA